MGRLVRDNNPLAQTPSSLVNFFSAAGYSPQTLPTAAQMRAAGIVANTSGALTSNTLATMLSITGSGVLNFIGVSSVNAASRTHRLQIILDGITVFDTTSVATAVTDTGGCAIGSAYVANSVPVVLLEQIPFSTSCVIKYASSVTETDKTNIYWKYRVN